MLPFVFLMASTWSQGQGAAINFLMDLGICKIKDVAFMCIDCYLTGRIRCLKILPNHYPLSVSRYSLLVSASSICILSSSICICIWVPAALASCVSQVFYSHNSFLLFERKLSSLPGSSGQNKVLRMPVIIVCASSVVKVWSLQCKCKH